MKKLAITFLLLAATFGISALHSFAQIKNVKKIYLASFGNDVISDLVREKMRSRLINSNRFTVVEKPDEADAILTGVTDLEKTEQGSISGTTGRKGGSIWGSSNTDFNAIGVFRLVHPESKATLWIYDYKPKWYRVSTGGNKANEEYNRIAKRVVERLIKDAAEAENGKPSNGK